MKCGKTKGETKAPWKKEEIGNHILILAQPETGWMILVILIT